MSNFVGIEGDVGPGHKVYYARVLPGAPHNAFHQPSALLETRGRRGPDQKVVNAVPECGLGACQCVGHGELTPAAGRQGAATYARPDRLSVLVNSGCSCYVFVRLGSGEIR